MFRDMPEAKRKQLTRALALNIRYWAKARACFLFQSLAYMPGLSKEHSHFIWLKSHGNNHLQFFEPNGHSATGTQSNGQR